ncbi:TrkH family potassium uptake protein [Pseudodonghicola flavimaris]|uniref:Trk system potassium uptake protein n=1 Tax=Pseudodonghicola flavimaris TaxID=3050036 RepID=A0ABT7EYP5_9RHOB|nr:TrkH family potassium uptake protein [Pseudodonghicola flavimaris]MDK3017473.1 TrkH family potassium uptake protein [Pseudodonghicola flavimaris]
MSFVVFINSVAMLAMSGLMALTALLFADSTPVFVEAFILCGLLGGAVALAGARSQHDLEPQHVFLVTASVWMTAALCGALPLMVWQLSPVDAFFEAMSGITTTGSTVMSGLDETPRGILFWRALLQAIGGIGFVVTGVALLPILKVGGMQLFRTESSEKGEKELANAARFALATLVAYGGLMAVCFLLYLLGGMSLFDAVTHAMTTLSTGGYSNYDASFGHFQSPFLQYTATIFMVLGGFPFAWYIRAILRRQFNSEQVRWLVCFLLGVSVMLTLWLVLVNDMEIEPAFRQVAFNVASVVTTTGYASTDYITWGPFAVAVFFAITAVGGCTGSTAGGAKMMRWIVFFRLTAAAVKRIRSPHQVVVARYEGRPIGPDVTSGVISFFTLYLSTVMVMAVVLNLLGLDFLTALSGALTAVANVGPGVGEIIGPSGNFATLNEASKLILSMGMYLGRLEMMTVLVLFTPVFWRAG